MFSVSRPMTPPHNEEPHNTKRQQRKQLFVDKRLQGVLLVALVLLETSMLVVAMIYLYQRFSAIIDANLFVIHRSAQTALLPEFLQQMGWVVLVMGVVNTLALFTAHALWSGHINRVIQVFRLRLQRIAMLDLRPLKQSGKNAHEVLDGLERWRTQEQTRLQQVRLLVDRISAQAPLEVPQAAHQVELRQLLLSLRRLLRPSATKQTER